MVDAKLVEHSDYTGKNVTLTKFDGSTVLSPLTRVWISFGDYQIHHVVAVIDETPEEVLLGLDVGFLDYLMHWRKSKRMREWVRRW